MDKNDSIILINKPCGMTSFKVTSAVRHKLGIKKAGHAGTLDPLAVGVLPVMTGRATRLIDLISDNKKRYIAGFMLGLTTDTLDNEGEILSEQPVLCTENDIKDAVSFFCGDIFQLPPMFSALKKDGQKLYELARKGQTVERKQRAVTIFSIKLLRLEKMDDTFVGEIDVTCSKGTYIRTLVDDIGMWLHCGAIMTTLRREYSNGFSIEDTVDFDEFMHSDNPEKYMHTPDFAVRSMPKITLTTPQAKRFSNGCEINADRVDANNADMDCIINLADENDILLRVYSNDIFLGLGRLYDGVIKPKCVF